MGDTPGLRTYAQAMQKGQPFVRLKLDIDTAIELSEFVAAFTAIASEYERFVRAERPGTDPDATLFVKEVRAGCIEADLVPWLAGGGLLLGAGAAITAADGFNKLDEFVERLGKRIKTYAKPGGRLAGATKGELKDFLDQVAAVASAPDSALSVASMDVHNGEERTRVSFRFDTNEAREIQQRIEEHKHQIDHTSRADHERVLLTFVRPDKRDAALGKRSGELVEISAISPKPRPLIYASAVAEQQIRHEVTRDDSIFNKGFVVDVNVETRGGKPVAYAITNLHQVIDLGDDDD